MKAMQFVAPSYLATTVKVSGAKFDVVVGYLSGEPLVSAAVGVSLPEDGSKSALKCVSVTQVVREVQFGMTVVTSGSDDKIAEDTRVLTDGAAAVVNHNRFGQSATLGVAEVAEAVREKVKVVGVCCVSCSFAGGVPYLLSTEFVKQESEKVTNEVLP